jgi:hypothetical protein
LFVPLVSLYCWLVVWLVGSLGCLFLVSVSILVLASIIIFASSYYLLISIVMNSSVQANVFAE